MKYFYRSILINPWAFWGSPPIRYKYRSCMFCKIGTPLIVSNNPNYIKPNIILKFNRQHWEI